MKRGLQITTILLLISISCVFGQFKYGADLYSRYIWRGMDCGNSPAIQPSVTYSFCGFSVGFWGSYSLAETTNPADNKKSTYSENDFIASYTLNLAKSGSVSVYFTDYYTPYTGRPFSYYKPENGSGAAHTLEPGIGYTGPEKLPVSIIYYQNVSNDPDNSAYIQAAYPFTINETTLTLSAGYVTKKSSYYYADQAGFINLGINVAKSIPVTEKFSIPINVSYINNPALDVSYLVFGLGFTF